MRRWNALIAGAALLAAAACGGGNAAGKTTGKEGPGRVPTIRMGWGIPAEETKYVMQANPGLAKGQGSCYKIEWHQFAGTAPGVQGLAAGTLDGATVGGLSVANGLDKGADIVLTGAFIEERTPNFGTPYMVPDSITSPAQLRGKTLSTVGPGASTDYIMDYWLKAHAGLEAGKDFTKATVPFGQLVEGMSAGRFAFGVFPQPFYTQMAAKGGFHPLFRVTDVVNPFVQLMQGFRRDFVRKNPKAVKCFMDDFAAVADYVNDPADREAVIAASSKATKIPAEVLRGYLLTSKDYYRPAHGAISVDAVQKQWDFFRQQGAFSRPLKVKDHLLDVSIVSGSGG